MRLQKAYKWYSIGIWALWICGIVLSEFSGNAFHIKNEVLYAIAYAVSRIGFFLALVPIHLGLFAVVLYRLISQGEKKPILLHCLSLLLTTLLAFAIVVTYSWLIGGV